MEIHKVLIIFTLIVLVFVFVWLLVSLKPVADTEWKETIRSELNRLSKTKNNPHKLVELDKLIDFYLKSVNIKGDTMGERLKNAKNQFPPYDYNLIWEAHKLRNKIVHEVGIKISPKDLHLYTNQIEKLLLKIAKKA